MDLQKKILEYLENYTEKKRWQRIIFSLAVTVSLLTSILMALPATAKTGRLTCNKEEHTHSEECYEYRPVSFQCEAVKKAHVHDDSCYSEEWGLVCNEDHEHTDTCYGNVKKLTCDKDVYIVIHKHDEKCYDSEGNLICPLKEIEGHVHDDSCYEEDEDGNKKLICGKEELIEHPEHTEECYTVNENGERVLTCTKPLAIAHQHTDECIVTEKVLTCDKEEHTHTDACYEPDDRPLEVKEEQPEEVKEDAVVFENDDTDVHVTVKAPKDAFPEGTTMTVAPVDSEEVIDAVEQTVGDKTVVTVKAVDITFRNGDEEVEPSGPISVTMSSDPVEEARESSVVHIDNKGSADIVAEAETASEDITFDTESFSVYVLTYTVDFHYEVDGKVYDFSIPGGGFVSFQHLIEVLGIDGVTRELSADEEAVRLNEVRISKTTKQFVTDVESIEFSDPSLVDISKVPEDMTVGDIRESRGLDGEYSAELTEEQIAEMNAWPVEAGDWALISLRPFDTEETMTVTMVNGDVFTINVTDAVVPADELVNADHYILYSIYEGQYYALRLDGYCYQVPNNNLNALGDDFLWCCDIITSGDYAGTTVWRSDDRQHWINLWGENLTTAIYQSYGSYITLNPGANGGYYFTTNNCALWLYYDYTSNMWRFVSGSGEGNRSVTYIYQKDPVHNYTVSVNDESRGSANAAGGDTSITYTGYNTAQVTASANTGYWFDHWELDGVTVGENAGIVTAADGSGSVISAGSLYIGNEDGHELKAVFVPQTSFAVEASPSGGGSVNRTSSPRTRDGYNTEMVSAMAANGWWFDHWEIDGAEAPEGSYTINENGTGSILPAGSFHIGDGSTLTAVFSPQIQYSVISVPETAGTNIPGCTVQVGESAAASVVNNNAMTRWGYNLADITANAGPGFVFKGWLLDDQPILGGADIVSALDGSSSTIKAGTLQVSPDGQVHTVKAMFAQEYNFTVTTYPNGGGKVQDDDKTAAAGPTIYASLTKDGHNKYDITAIPNSDYYFSHWMLNGQPFVEGEGAQQHYKYTDGVIPEGELQITSSDNLCAVFIKNVYSITVKNDGHGRTAINNETGSDKNDKTCLTNNTASEVKQARNRITATPDNGYKFAYWKVEDPHEAVVDWGQGYSVRSATIQPNVNSDTTLTAMFVSSSQRVFTVTVDDPSHGTVWGPDVSGANASSDAVGVTAYVAKTEYNNNHQVNNGRPQVRTAAAGYQFLGWNLYDRYGNLVKSYQDNDNQGNALKKWQLDNRSVWFDQDDMVLMAMFAEKEVPPAFEDEAMEDLSEWAEGIAGTDFLKDKKAEVFDYDNRIYRIEISASSLKQAIDSSVVVNFITDTSRSMYFPANITQVGDYGNQGGNSYGAKLNSWLSNKNRNNVYYIISQQNSNATLNAVYYNYGTNRWEYVDASYYPPNSGDGMIRDGSAVTGFNGASGDNYAIYQAPPREEGKPWSRLDYLCMSVEAAVKAIYDICPNAQIDLTTFNRSATYKGTIPNNAAAIEMLLRNIDVTGGTRQDLGLAAAISHFTEGSAKRQVAVLITDGAPNSGIGTVSEENIWSWASSNAETLREITDADGNKLELYTMGLSLDRNRQNFLSSLATQGDGYAYAVNSGMETSNAIKNIVNNLLSNVSLFGTITDTVDPAFYPVDKNGEPIAAGLYAADGSSLSTAPQDNSPYCEWRTDDNGVWTITWHNQTMPWAVDENTPGWKNEFYIKAKEDFLGGNKIPTNYGDDNGITATGYVKLDTSVAPLKNNEHVIKKFSSPHVNVDELHMEGNNTEWTVYLGTEVDPASQIVNLLKEIPVKQVVMPGGTEDEIYITGAGQMYYPHDSSAADNDDENAPPRGESQTLPLSHYAGYTDRNGKNIIEAVTDALAELSQSGTDSVMVEDIVYNEYGHAAGRFTVTLTKQVNADAAADGAPNPHETKLAGQAVETYTLNVKYTPYTDGAAETYEHTVEGGSSGRITAGTGDDEVISQNSHVINVIEKGIRVIKTDETTGDTIQDRTAEFKLYRALKDGESPQTTITVSGTDVPVTEVTDLITGGAEGADQADSLPWYESGDGQHDGQYFLKEISAPYGYLMLTEPAVITVTRTDSYTDINGEPVETITDIAYNNDQTAEVIVELYGESQTLTESSGIFELTIPNPQKGSLALRKEVQTINDADINDMNGLYTFSVSGPVGSDNPFTYYLVYKVENGGMTHYWFEKYAGNNAERNPDNILLSDEGDVVDQDAGYVITDMETGIYALKEYLWILDDNTVNADDIYLKDIVLNPASGGNTNDVIARTTSVLVTADNPAERVLTVTFINEYGPDRYAFDVKKIWEDAEGNRLPDPWDGMISRIDFTVTQISNEGTGDEVVRHLTFDGGEKLTIQRYGQRALLAPAEPGSAEYTLHLTRGGDTWQTLVSGLEKTAPDGSPYTYRIEEICVRDVYGDIVTGYETTYDLSDNGGQLIKMDGRNVGIRKINNGADAFIINKQILQAELNLKKIVEASGEYPVNGNLILADGSCTFTVTGPEGADSPVTWYVKINASSTDHGENVSPRYTTAYTYQIGETEAERDAMAPVSTVNGGVPIEVTPGRYIITESSWSFAAPVGIGEMYLEDIGISSGSNQETDIPQNKAEVYVGEGEIGSLAVTFTNRLKPYPGIQIVKIDESTRPEEKTTEYLSGAEFQILKWDGSRYTVYPNEEDSKVVTDDDGTAVFGGIGSGEYKIIETVTPVGYVKPLENDIYIHVEYNESTGLHTITRYKEAYTGDDSVSRTTVSESENELGITFEQATAAGPAVFTVGNTPGAALPKTGGSGTALIYLLGIMLAGIAGAGLMMRKHRRTA